MRVYLPDPKAYFDWLDSAGYAYVIMRGFLPFEHGFPAAGSKHDIDMLVEDRALPVIAKKYASYRKHQGTPCDVYDVITRSEGTYHPRSYYPPTLAQAMLTSRRRWKGLFYTPDARHYMLALAYHRLYRKKYPRSGVVYAAGDPAFGGLYADEMAQMAQEAGESFVNTMDGLEAFLQREGHAISYEDMAATLQDYACSGYRSYFFAKRCAGLEGQVSLVLPRRAADVKKLNDTLDVLVVKPLSWWHKIKILFADFPLLRHNRPLDVLLAYAGMIVFEVAPDKAQSNDPFIFYRPMTELPCSRNEAEALGMLPLVMHASERSDVIKTIMLRRA